MKLAILTPNLSSNAVGRAVVLAELYAGLGEVEIVGHQFGRQVWPPIAGSPTRIRKLKGRTWATICAAFRENMASLNADIFVVSKRLAPSLLYAWALTRRGNNILLDFDDDEIGLHRGQRLAVRLIKPVVSINSPMSRLWTVLADKARWPNAGTTVASLGLQRRYGGSLLYHLRSEAMLRGGSVDGELAHRVAQLMGGPSVVFLGTPRAHKGLGVLAKAIGICRQEVPVVLGVFGCDDTRAIERELQRYLPSDAYFCHGTVPLSSVEFVLKSATVVAVPQQLSPGSEQQTPAKIFDAMCVGVALLTTDVGDIGQIVGHSAKLVARPDDALEMASALRELLGNPVLRSELQVAIRDRFIAHFSTGATRKRVFAELDVLGRSYKVSSLGGEK